MDAGLCGLAATVSRLPRFRQLRACWQLRSLRANTTCELTASTTLSNVVMTTSGAPYNMQDDGEEEFEIIKSVSFLRLVPIPAGL